MYGGLLFLGVFFTILFLTNTVLIIYFKQVSEGFEDRERFRIMRQVGMADEEVRRTINKQILWVFFLPLMAALLHLAAASGMILRMLSAFQLNNILLILLCLLGSAALFTLVYTVVFRLTARVYYKLVR